MNKIIQNIRKELQKNIDLKHKEGEYRFFKGEIQNYGVKSGIVRRIAKKYFKEMKDLPKNKIFTLSEELLQSGYNEEATIAFQWIFSLKKQYQKEDFSIFEKFLAEYVTNWAKCDDFLTHNFGHFILKFPEYLPRIKKVWVTAENKWLKRGAAVILIPVIKKDSKFLKDVFEITDSLLLDRDDLVCKGYGWLLKETSSKYQKEVFDYVMKHKNYMPRVSLRYAIEKMPQNLKQQAMAR